ncbi:MAG: hypothetical protein KIT69_13970 [Propionibacteriaceae bacterium]|nr:hypothetical protein [Propionibacteriaceae bacterium]
MNIFTIIIVIILLIIIIYVIYKNIQDTPDTIAEKITKQENYYNKNTFGYYYNGPVFKLLKEALQRDKNEASIIMAKNAKLIGDIYNYQINDGETARFYYSIAVNRLEKYQKHLGQKVDKTLQYDLTYNIDPTLVNANDLLDFKKLNMEILKYKDTLKLADQIEQGLNSDNMKQNTNNTMKQNTDNTTQQNTDNTTQQNSNPNLILQEQFALMNDIESLRKLTNNNNKKLIITIKSLRKNKKNKQVQDQQILPQNIVYTATVKSDGQNVHDSEVMHEMLYKYKRIKFLNGLTGKTEILTPESVDALEQAFRKYYEIKNEIDQIKVNRAIYVVHNIIANVNQNSNLDDNEQVILSEVWGRINSPDNRAKYPQLINALVDQLTDCVKDNSNTVCETGRINRILDTFTLLDSDNVLSKPPMSKDLIRNQVLPNMGILLQQKISELPENVRNDYNNGNQTVEVVNFENKMKNLMIETIDNTYPNISTKVKNQIKEEAIAGI